MGKSRVVTGESVRLTRAASLLLAGALVAMLVMPGIAAAYEDAPEPDDVFETAPSLGWAPINGYVSSDMADPNIDYTDQYAITLAAGEKFTVRVLADSGSYGISDDTPEKNHVVRPVPDGFPFFTPVNGIVEITYTPTKAGKYYVGVHADTNTKTNYVLTWTAAKHITVTKPNAPSTMYKGKAKTIFGYLKPQHTAGTYPVRIYKYRYVSGDWKSYGYVNAKASNYSTYTKYSKTFSLPYKGKWRLRAVAPADSAHVIARSSYDYVTVK